MTEPTEDPKMMTAARWVAYVFIAIVVMFLLTGLAWLYKEFVEVLFQ